MAVCGAALQYIDAVKLFYILAVLSVFLVLMAVYWFVYFPILTDLDSQTTETRSAPRRAAPASAAPAGADDDPRDAAISS
jgi:hypothetical protein